MNVTQSHIMKFDNSNISDLCKMYQNNECKCRLFFFFHFGFPSSKDLTRLYFQISKNLIRIKLPLQNNN